MTFAEACRMGLSPRCAGCVYFENAVIGYQVPTVPPLIGVEPTAPKFVVQRDNIGARGLCRHDTPSPQFGWPVIVDSNIAFCGQWDDGKAPVA